ncbi:allatostatin-like [Oppia nitens]|uniref:allatostatin-like n=1 Tax=Oppia nitens TaxID=1686743 RepID=UPI0023DBBDC7|nr:allatostatin-like [Oppia nitens]
MISMTMKISICSLIVSLMVYTLAANSDINDGRNKMSLPVVPDTIDEDALNEYNRALYLDKLDKLGAIINNPKHRVVVQANNMGGSPVAGYEGHQKRQIRYHQCYFNPISCFRRRK